MFDFDIRPMKTEDTMDFLTASHVSQMDYGGWFNKATLQIAIYGKHYTLEEYADTINHECLHLIIQEFLGGKYYGLGWEASTALDHKSMDDIANLHPLDYYHKNRFKEDI